MSKFQEELVNMMPVRDNLIESMKAYCRILALEGKRELITSSDMKLNAQEIVISRSFFINEHLTVELKYTGYNDPYLRICWV